MSTARERVAKFAALWETTHPKQPLEDTIYHLNCGDPSEAELLLSDLKELLAATAPAPAPVAPPPDVFVKGDLVEVIDRFASTKGKRGLVAGVSPMRADKLEVRFEGGWLGFYLPAQLKRVP